MINFETSEMIDQVRTMLYGMVKNIVRPIARYYDVHEHERPKELEAFKPIMQAGMGGGKRTKKEKKEIKQTEDRIANNAIGIAGAEELAWGDVGLMLALPGGGLGNAAVNAVATDEQFERFGMKYCAMAITEPGCGSDASAVSATAVLNGDEYVINGEKIFVTDGDRCEAVVVWATLDKSKGRAAIKSFVVERGPRASGWKSSRRSAASVPRTPQPWYLKTVASPGPISWEILKSGLTEGLKESCRPLTTPGPWLQPWLWDVRGPPMNLPGKPWQKKASRFVMIAPLWSKPLLNVISSGWKPSSRLCGCWSSGQPGWRITAGPTISRHPLPRPSAANTAISLSRNAWSF
jgi:hypothetical protein